MLLFFISGIGNAISLTDINNRYYCLKKVYLSVIVGSKLVCVEEIIAGALGTKGWKSYNQCRNEVASYFD